MYFIDIRASVCCGFCGDVRCAVHVMTQLATENYSFRKTLIQFTWGNVLRLLATDSQPLGLAVSGGRRGGSESCCPDLGGKVEGSTGENWKWESG